MSVPGVVGALAAVLVLAATPVLAGNASGTSGAEARPPVNPFVIVDGVARSPVTVTIGQDAATRRVEQVLLPATFQLDGRTQVVTVAVVAGEHADSLSCLIGAEGGRIVSRKSGAGAYTSVLCGANLGG
jgi:hypothetical protein